MPAFISFCRIIFADTFAQPARPSRLDWLPVLLPPSESFSLQSLLSVLVSEFISVLFGDLLDSEELLECKIRVSFFFAVEVEANCLSSEESCLSSGDFSSDEFLSLDFTSIDVIRSGDVGHLVPPSSGDVEPLAPDVLLVRSGGVWVLGCGLFGEAMRGLLGDGVRGLFGGNGGGPVTIIGGLIDPVAVKGCTLPKNFLDGEGEGLPLLPVDGLVARAGMGGGTVDIMEGEGVGDIAGEDNLSRDMSNSTITYTHNKVHIKHTKPCQ